VGSAIYALLGTGQAQIVEIRQEVPWGWQISPKRLLEEISPLRKALESHHSISKDPKHRFSVDRVR
jgi:hypothetical protein